MSVDEELFELFVRRGSVRILVRLRHMTEENGAAIRRMGALLREKGRPIPRNDVVTGRVWRGGVFVRASG